MNFKRILVYLNSRQHQIASILTIAAAISSYFFYFSFKLPWYIFLPISYAIGACISLILRTSKEIPQELNPDLRSNYSKYLNIILNHSELNTYEVAAFFEKIRILYYTITHTSFDFSKAESQELVLVLERFNLILADFKSRLNQSDPSELSDQQTTLLTFLNATFARFEVITHKRNIQSIQNLKNYLDHHLDTQILGDAL